MRHIKVYIFDNGTNSLKSSLKIQQTVAAVEILLQNAKFHCSFKMWTPVQQCNVCTKQIFLWKLENGRNEVEILFVKVELFVISTLEQVCEGGRDREKERMTALKLRNGHNFQQQILSCFALSPFLFLTISFSSISSSSISSLHSSLYSSSSLSYSFLCHTHFVGCPQKGELKHVCQITHTHCVLCNLASAALCVCLCVHVWLYVVVCLVV